MYARDRHTKDEIVLRVLLSGTPGLFADRPKTSVCLPGVKP